MKSFFLTTLLSLILLISCDSKENLDSSKAQQLIEFYLEEKPMFEVGKFDTDEQRFISSKNEKILAVINELVDNGFVTIDGEKSRKKWFSKDSVFIITPTLTKKAIPYVVEQNKNYSTVKTIIYSLYEEKEIQIEKNGDKSATCIAVLAKGKTPFYAFGKDNNPKSEFITRKFKLKFDKELGWEVVK